MLHLLFALGACSDTAFNKVEEPVDDGVRALTVDPGIVDFGVVPGQVTEVLTLTATGDLPVYVEGVGIQGSSAYAVTWAGNGTTLEPGDTTDLVVTYTPASIADVADLLVHSNAEDPELVVELSGGGLYAAILVEPAALTLWSNLGETVDGQVRVASVGTADLQLGSMVVQGGWFDAVGDVPATLAPGEELWVDVTYTPEAEGETVEGELWFGTNTLSGYAVVPLTGINGTPCVGLGEAWDRGWLTAYTNFAGTLVVTETSGTADLCVDTWYVYMSDDSQDLGAGDLEFDLSGEYPFGSLTIPAGEDRSFDYGGRADTAWYCVEETQYTDAAAQYRFTGARVPDMLLDYMLAYNQDGVWNTQSGNPVILTGRDTNVVDLGLGGGTAPVSLHLWNAGGQATDFTLTETVPLGFTATDWSPTPDWTTSNSDGSTTYGFELSLEARVETGLYDPTQYDEAVLGYTLQAGPCSGVITAPVATSTWLDSAGGMQSSTANPLVIRCR